MTRTGLGFDLHPLVDGRPLVLGGVTVPGGRGLSGHSDADVLTHAIGEALLGALALGDLGRHFPDTDPRYAGVSSLVLLRAVMDLLVEKGAPGFTTRDYEGKFSLRASVTSELIFQDVKLPADAMLPKSDGLKSALKCLTQARYGIAWGTIGLAMAVFDEALRYGKSREQFGRPIAGFQLQQRKLAWMATEITKGQLLNLQVGRLKEAGKVTFSHVSMAKMNGCRVARECSRYAREMLGANGLADEYQTGRHFCNIEAVYTYEGTDDIHTLILGEALTGLPAYSG